MLYDIGEKPGKGTYRCVSCDAWEVRLDDDSDRLPPWPGDDAVGDSM